MSRNNHPLFNRKNKIRPSPENGFSPGFGNHVLQVVLTAVCESCSCGFQVVYLGSSGIKTLLREEAGLCVPPNW